MEKRLDIIIKLLENINNKLEQIFKLFNQSNDAYLEEINKEDIREG